MKTIHTLFMKALALAKHGTDDVCLGIELGAADGRLTFCARAVTRDIRVVIPGDGDLPTKTYAYRALAALAKACKKDKSGDLTITDTLGGLRFEASGRTFDLPATKSGLRSEPPEFAGDQVVEGFGAPAFVDALGYVMPARSKDDTREHLHRIHLDGGRMFATNGFVVHMANAIGGSIAARASFQGARAIVDAVKASDADWVMMRLWHKRSKKGDVLSTAMEVSIDGPLLLAFIREYKCGWSAPPNVDQLLKGGKDRFSVDAKALAESMATAHKVLRAHGQDGIRGVEMLVNGDLRVATDQFSEVLSLAKKATRKQTLRVNPSYMQDAVKVDGNIVVAYGDTLDPLVITAGDRVAVVMPMRK